MDRQEAIKRIKTFIVCGMNHQLVFVQPLDYEAFEVAIEALERCQRIDNRFANAKKTDWVRKGFTDEEVSKICNEARENARKALQTETFEDAVQGLDLHRGNTDYTGMRYHYE